MIKMLALGRHIIWLMLFPILTRAQQPVKIFILAGQSNMVGHGEVYPGDNHREAGTLVYEAAHDTTGLYKNIRDSKGNWLVRSDVWIRFDKEEEGIKKGDLTVGYGATDKEIGPELQFGNVLGNSLSQQILLIKTAWGGKSLGVDFRPPGSGAVTGSYYKKMIAEIQKALLSLGDDFKEYKSQGYELAGFVWNQGWNDAGDSVLYREYRNNMIHFIKDVREDLHSPQLPFVIITAGQGGMTISRDKWMSNVQRFICPAQIEAASSPEFLNNVAIADSRPFWKDSLESPATEIHHYNRNAGTYFLMGNEAGLAMLRLLDTQKSIKRQSGDIPKKDTSRQINGSGLMGYISFKTSPQPAGFSSGIGFYSAVYQMLPEPIEDFQIGLASTWITPDNSDNITRSLCPPGSYARENWEQGRGPTFKDVFQTIEGGLGIWGSTQFRSGYTSPKFQIVGVPDCYTGNYLISPGWGNNTVATPDTLMGIAQLSNRLLIPPDGITFQGKPTGELFGYSWMSLPFSGAKNEQPPTGNQYWTLFFAVANFKGPAAFIIPESWSKISHDYVFDYGRGLDNRGGRSGGGAQEINTVPYFEMKDAQGRVYSKIPQFLYPVDHRGETILIQDVRYYSEKALANAVENWRLGGIPCTGSFLLADSASRLAKLKPSPLNFHQTDERISLSGFEKVVSTSIFNDSTAFGLKWSDASTSPRGILPQYFKQTGNDRVAVSVSDVPSELSQKKFDAAINGTAYSSPRSGAWIQPGPVSGPYFAYLSDGSRLTYYWYRFIDQPSLQQYKNTWSDSLKKVMQSLVEQIHRHWSIDQVYMPPPSNGKPLVNLDAALIVQPPKGLEVGYVPIVTKQEGYQGRSNNKSEHAQQE